MSKASVGFDMLNADKLIKQLEQLDIAIRETIGAESLRAGMRPVENAVRAETPESRITGSRKKQSKRTREKWSGSKTLKNAIRSVVRTRRKAGITAGMLGLVGPSYSEGGGHGNLFSKNHKRKVLWGRNTGTVRVVNQFVKRAADQSRSAASSALIAALTSGINNTARATTNG